MLKRIGSAPSTATAPASSTRVVIGAKHHTLLPAGLITQPPALGAPRLRQMLPASQRHNSRMDRRRLKARDRMRQLRERAKQHRRDPVSYFLVPLPESVIHQLVADLGVKAGANAPIDDATWRRLVGLLVAKVVKLAVSKKL